MRRNVRNFRGFWRGDNWFVRVKCRDVCFFMKKRMMWFLTDSTRVFTLTFFSNVLMTKTIKTSMQFVNSRRCLTGWFLNSTQIISDLACTPDISVYLWCDWTTALVFDCFDFLWGPVLGRMFSRARIWVARNLSRASYVGQIVVSPKCNSHASIYLGVAISDRRENHQIDLRVDLDSAMLVSPWRIYPAMLLIRARIPNEHSVTNATRVCVREQAVVDYRFARKS